MACQDWQDSTIWHTVRKRLRITGDGLRCRSGPACRARRNVSSTGCAYGCRQSKQEIQFRPSCTFRVTGPKGESMPAIRKSLLQLLFSGFTMRRWNDKLRPVELFEIDKQAHKMIVAFLLTHIGSRSLCAPKRLELQQKVVERGIFDYLYRLIITDIKPPVFYKIRENPQHYSELTEWVLDQLQPVVKPLDPAPGGFWDRLADYHRRITRDEPADRILRAAHLYASQWEFEIIRPFNAFDEEMDSIARSFESQLDAMTDVAGLADIRGGQNAALGSLAALCGRLRFQIRWSGTSRIPETSVLGHEYLVAVYAYCLSLIIGGCRARCLNNFHAGLFHDLPELLTRDIISPVKRSVSELPELIKNYEAEEMERLILTPLHEAGHTDLETRLRYVLGLDGDGVTSEFDETCRDNDGHVRRVPGGFDELHARCNQDDSDPKDGLLIKACDNLAAFMEAETSIRNGVASSVLREARFRLAGTIRDVNLGQLALSTVMADFD